MAKEAGTRHFPRLVVGVVAMVLGVGALVVGTSLATLDSGGWPWTTTLSEQSDPPRATARIVEDSGTVHQHTGSPSEVRAWLAATEDRLKESYDIPAKILVGRVARWAGVALLVLGSAVLLQRYLISLSRRRRARP